MGVLAVAYIFDCKNFDSVVDSCNCICGLNLDSALVSDNHNSDLVAVVVTAHHTTDVVVEEQEFAESKAASQNNGSGSTPVSSDGFLNIPDGVDTQLPFN